MDSQLVVRQITGVYKVKQGSLRPLHAEILELLRALNWHAVAHIPREETDRADELANLAYDMPTI